MILRALVFHINFVLAFDSHNLFKRLFLEGYEWTQFVHIIPSFHVATRIECGGHCNLKDSGCDLFIHELDLEKNEGTCHLGIFDNSNKNLLTSSGVGENPVYVKLDRIHEMFEATYYELTYIEDEKYWTKYFYANKKLPLPNDFMDCSFVCNNVEKDNGCEIFYFQDQTCYLGYATKSDGTQLGSNLLNKTLFATIGALNTITSPIAYKNNVVSSHWTNHIEQSHSDAIKSLKQCEALALFEKWHYTVYDGGLQTCYFGMIGTENKMEVADTTTRQMSINYGELTKFVPETFVERQSRIYQPYTYVRFAYPVNEAHCGMHCFMDSDMKCDFFFIHSHWCYLGNFNEAAPIGSTHDLVTAYIYSISVSDMIDKLFPTTIEVAQNKLFSKEKEKFDAVSELECGAHAALAENNIDYWRYTDNGKCILGELNHNKALGTSVALREIRIVRGNAWSDLNSMYNEQFTLYSAIWTKYIYKTYTLKTGEDQTECGVYCEMSVETCNFFLIASGKCHLGRYDYYGSGTVLDSNVPTTYHKTSASEPYILNDKFWWFNQIHDWNRFVYKYEHRTHTRKCAFECYHDDTCDFYVDVHSYCLYGRYSYTGNTIIGWTDNVNLYNKKGKNPPASIITNNFNDAYGNKDKQLSHYWNWRSGIYGHYSDTPTEELCAFRCLVSWIEKCMYYFWGHGHCQLGNYINTANQAYGSTNANTKYKVMKELSNAKIGELMKGWMGGSSVYYGRKPCRNVGYRNLASNGKKVIITSGENTGYSYYTYKYYKYYYKNENCRWAIHAPGAKQIRVTLNQLETSSGDWARVYLGMSFGGYYYQHWERKTSLKLPYSWTYDAEFMMVRWYSNGDWYYDDGFVATFERIG